MSKHTEIFERVSARLLDAVLDTTDRKSWTKPWTTIARGWSEAEAPLNVASRKPYRGSNVAWLTFAAASEGWDLAAPWGTYKQWQDMGAQVVKGSKATPGIFWKRVEKREKDETTGEDKTRSILIAKGFSLFHAAQVEGFDVEAWKVKVGRTTTAPELPEPTADWGEVAEAEAIFAEYAERCRVRVDWKPSNSAFYTPALHAVTMPSREQFKTASGAMSTLAHELSHSTGHSSLLARKFGGAFETVAYAEEELVAECSAAFLLALTGVANEGHIEFDNHTAYLQSWLREAARGDAAKALTYALQRADKAARLVAASVLEVAEEELQAA